MKFLPFILKSAARNPVRALLTVLGAAVAVFIFTAVVSLDQGMRRMLARSAGDDTLTVFDRYQGCPPLSKLPSAYEDQVARVEGVADVTSTLFVLSACSRATDLVAVHGVDPKKFRAFTPVEVPADQYAAFAAERGAALVGAAAARQYGWQVGQAVSLPKLHDVSFTVRGIFRAPGNSLENAILVDADYLRFAAKRVGQTTLITAKVADPARAAQVAERIDALFASSGAPTKTTPERAFVAAAISGVVGIIEFSRWLGYVALGILLLGVANSLSMTIRDRTRELAILKTVGFRRGLVMALVTAEAVAASLAGGVLGAALAWLAVNRSGFAFSVEGYTIVPHVSGALLAAAVGLSAALGLLGAFLPALRGSRLPVVKALREVD